MNKHKPKYTDKEIIECLKTGNNSKALEFLYLDIFPKIKSYVISNSGNEDDALDIFQDAIVTLCNQIKLNKYNPEYQVAGFVYSVCRNMWINRAKRNKKMVYTSEEIDVREDEDFTEHIRTKQNDESLKKIISLLGEKCFELLKMSVFYKASSNEICEEMGFATENSVKTQKYKCKQKLFKILENNYSLKEILE